MSIATQTETATGLPRAGGGNYADGEAGEQGTPAAIAVDTIQDGLLDVQVHQPAEGQEAVIAKVGFCRKPGLGNWAWLPALGFLRSFEPTATPRLRIWKKNPKGKGEGG